MMIHDACSMFIMVVGAIALAYACVKMFRVGRKSS